MWASIKQEFANEFVDTLYMQYMPGAAEYVEESGVGWLVRTQTKSLLPMYGLLGSEMQEDSNSNRVKFEETEGETAWNGRTEAVDAAVTDSAKETEPDLTEEEIRALMETENQAATVPVAFVPRSQRVQVDLEELTNYEALVKSFYTIDANTMAGSEELNVKRFLEQDMKMEKDGEAPQILIYHTHSQEAFADSVAGDESTTILGVGERLAEILREEYGYQVLHHTGKYDVESRDDAYGESLPALQDILEQNPSIEVVIDLHRDQMPEETRLVMDLDGRPTARFMFFNGLSRTKQSGDIDYLLNDNLDRNLAFSFQMQLKCEEYYPGLTRKIYLKGYRYNMHLRPRTLLVELGAQNNTVEEAMNACDPLAHVLDMVLSGE